MIDLWPRDDASACSADMTRTFVVGEVPGRGRANGTGSARRRSTAPVADIRPGVTGKSVFEGSCEIFEAAGYPTQRTKPAGETLAEGFFHSLGHGVGLEVHE